MENHFLTTQNLLKGKILGFFEQFLVSQKVYKDENNKRYKKIRDLNAGPYHPDSTIGIYEASNKKKVIIKIFHYKLHNLNYEHVVNEANILKLLNNSEYSQTTKVKVGFPKFYEFFSSNDTLTLVTEYVKGRNLSLFSNDVKKKTILECVNFLNSISEKIDRRNLKNLPKRTPSHIILTFPIYFTIALLKNFKSFKDFFKLVIIFYVNYLNSGFGNPEYVITHRDLHPQNIIVSDKNIFIIDPEMCALLEKGTEIAITLRLYIRELGFKIVDEILKEVLKTTRQRKKFIGLTIFYTIQTLAIENPNNPEYLDAHMYMKYILNGIMTGKI